MKKIATLLIALLSIAFVSCDKDADMAIRLNGQWKGDMGMFYTYSDGYGHVYDYDATYTDIKFYWSNGSHGYGEQIDYYLTGPYYYQSYYFDWSVDNGIVYMYYKYDSQLNCSIYDYYMDDDIFTGRINNTKFTLVKLADYNNWNLYDDSGYGYGQYDYIKTRADQSVSAPKIIKRGSRFMEKKQAEN